MLVKNWMSRPAITIDANAYMQDAVKLLKKHNIRNLPVIQNGRLVGFVTDKDLSRAAASEVTRLEHIPELLYMITNIKIQDIMNRDLITILQNQTVEQVAKILLQNRLQAAPVVDNDGNLVGVITQTDIFRVLVSLTGVEKSGVQFAFQLEDLPGSIKEVADIMRKYGCRMVSILSTYENVPEGYRNVYIRVRDCDREKLGQLKEELALKAKVLYVVDHQ